MSLFKKPKKNFRSRKVEDNSEEDQDDDVIIESYEPPYQRQEPVIFSAPAKKPKKKKVDKDKPPRSSSILSFHDDETGDGDEVFQVKKSSHSRRVAKMLKREHKKEKEEAEKMREEFPALFAGSEDSQNGHTPVDMELGSDVEAPTGNNFKSEEEEIQEESSPEAPPKNDPFGNQNLRDMISGGQIPDAALIHMARKRRQQARERGDEFIPLDDTQKAEKTSSRLVREDENDLSDDEDERINFSVTQREQELRKIQNTILEAEQGSHSEGSDQERDWEEQQIRKGVQAGVSAQGDVDETTKQYQQIFFGNIPPSYPTVAPSREGFSSSSNIVATRAAPPRDLPPITIDVIKKRLQDRLEELTSVHRAHRHECNDLESRMDNCHLDINSQSGSKGGLEGRYRFFQQMRGYVRDLIECLAEKMTSINYLDRCMMQQWKVKAEKLIKRGQQDVKDQSQDYMPHKLAMKQTGVSGDSAEDAARQRRAAEREARRARRRRAREALSVTDHHDGMSTDDEENKSESTKYQMERGQIMSSVDTMFEDTVDDFHDVDLIKARFEEWKYDQGDSYEEAYIGLCLPKVFTPIIKLNLIDWNPLEAGCKNIEESKWYESLMFYGFKEGQDPRFDSDFKLVPSIVEKVILLKLTAIVETVWDPMSTKQTKCLARLVRSFVSDYPTMSWDSKNTQGLLYAVSDRIRKTLSDDVFVPLYPKQVLENKNSGASQFFHRQLWTCIKLLGNIMEWQDILSDSLLQQLGLDSLLNRYVVLALHNSIINNDNLAKCRAITTVLPKSWFTDLDTDSTIPQLENFCRHLVNAATTFAQLLSTADSEATKYGARENLKQIRKLLVTIHALDHASTLAENFCIKS